MDRVVVAMSGGVDSSVAAALLVEQGYDVIGVMMRLWSEPEPIGFEGTNGAGTNRCCSVESVQDARAVASRIGIPFYVIDTAQPFKREVVDPFVEGYASGLTPNPCLACNRKIRFGHLLSYARSLGARYLATGHYAQVQRSETGDYQLWRGADPAKDQSYVLSVLGQADLASTLFPVGCYTKAEVRALAAGRGLPTASRTDSQDLCFVADGDYRRFLAQHAPGSVRPGPIYDSQGRQLGTHRGLPFYTIGQRSGLGIAASEPLYVLELDAPNNALIVGGKGDLGHRVLRTGRVNWVSGITPPGPFQGLVQIRYRSRATAATVVPLQDGGAEVHFVDAMRDITPGQAAVIYDGDQCLGGGLIAGVE